MYKYFKMVGSFCTGNYIYFWKPKGLSDENITALTAGLYSLNPKLSYLGTKTRAEFKESCLKQDKVTYDYILNIYIVYEISKNFNISSYSTLENCFLVELVSQKMLTLISINILGMKLDFIDMDFFLILVVEVVEM